MAGPVTSSPNDDLLAVLRAELEALHKEMDGLGPGVSEEELQSLAQWVEGIEGMVKAASLSLSSPPSAVRAVLLAAAAAARAGRKDVVSASVRRVLASVRA